MIHDIYIVNATRLCPDSYLALVTTKPSEHGEVRHFTARAILLALKDGQNVTLL